MKKFFKSMMLVAVAAMGFACAQETAEVAPEKQTKTITVNCDITRVAFNDGNSALVWQEGDTIAAYTDGGNVNVQSSAYPADFTLEVSADATKVYAYYPYYDGNDEKTAESMSIGIKGTITQSEAGKITTLGAIPMIAVGNIYDNTVDLLFEPYACVLAYNVYGGTSETEKVTSIKFTGDKKSSGYDYYFDLTVCDVAEYTPSYDYTQVNLTEDAQFVPNGTKPAGVSANAVFMPVAKQVYGAGSTIVVTTSKDVYTFTATGDINCNQGYATLNLNLAKAEKASDSIVEADIAEGDYVLAVKSGDVYYAMAGTNTTNADRLDQVDITSIFNTENITTNNEALVWTITKTTGGYYFEYDSKYLYGSSSSNHGKIGKLPDELTVDNNPIITLEDNGDGTYKVISSIVANKSLALNVQYNYFAFYKDTTITNDATGYPSNFYIVPVTYVAEPSITVGKNTVTISSTGEEGTVAVTTKNVDGEVNVSYDDVDWFVAELDEDGNLYYIAAENESTEEDRSVVVTLSYGDVSASITFTQVKKVISSGNETKASIVFAEQGLENAQAVSNFTIDGNIDVKFAQGNAGTAPTYYNSGNAVRLYQNGAIMTITAKNGKTIKSIVLTYGSKMGYIAPAGGSWVNDEKTTGTWTGDATEVVFTTTGTSSSTRAYIASIEVTYI